MADPRIHELYQDFVNNRIDRRGPWQLRFKSLGGTFRPDLRAVSVKMNEPRFVRAGAPSVPTLRVEA